MIHCWIVNLRDDCVEVRRLPEPRRYASTAIARRGEQITLAALTGVAVAVDDLLPSRALTRVSGGAGDR